MPSHKKGNEAGQMGKNSQEKGSDAQTDRDLFKATLPFGVESVKTSWWVVGSTFLMLFASPWCSPRTRVAATSVVLCFIGVVNGACLHHVPRLYAQRGFVTLSTCMVVVPLVRRSCANAATVVEEQPQFSPWSCWQDRCRQRWRLRDDDH